MAALRINLGQILSLSELSFSFFAWFASEVEAVQSLSPRSKTVRLVSRLKFALHRAYSTTPRHGGVAVELAYEERVPPRDNLPDTPGSAGCSCHSLQREGVTLAVVIEMKIEERSRACGSPGR